ncbi:MAG: single-stranded-DNA-specific exonuclease RecJ [Bacteroidales bacterium]|nr:single-stranded-DNA-specific exonuclease RecJ [Bacteroidales bacterium]MDD3906984.1 single-stranded-DNA-specific exonuclease RecJ [Bacteroidales bacterium]MDD4713158.1 single-stranded-DNA-specific exonuclease RecJ [Bacteroidales bacterium]
MINKWNYLTLTSDQTVQKESLAKELGISPILAHLLVQRGIKSFDQAKQFFRPQLSDLHDPFLMNDMDKAVARLNAALQKKEHILIYGDYDVDGTSAVALVYKFLQQFSSNIGYYIPDRYGEGYGISHKGIDFAAENGYKLMIALDCGIKAIEKIDYAKTKGIDFIICDHHVPDDKLPDAIAVLDAKRVDSTYPYDQLSGCGVGFKFMQAFAQNNNIKFSDLTPLLDLVAISIASDIVPITGENRILAYYGLKQLNSNPSVGLKAIIETCGLIDKDITISDIVFKIGPRLNASGRIETGNESVELMTTNDPVIARRKSDEINQYNQTRKDLDKNITEEANSALQACTNLSDRKGIVVYNEEWHKGVIGIVASRLTEEYYRPAIVLTRTDDLATGSARSVPGFDIYKAIDHCRDLLENFGGHTYAAGLSMKVEKVPEFTKRFEDYVAKNILPEQMVPTVDIDAELSFKEITPKFIRQLKLFSPFGPDNAKPTFCTKSVSDYGTSRLFGREMNHLKLELIDKDSQNIMNGIAFSQQKHINYVKSRNTFDIAYSIEENNYNGGNYTQLLIKDIKTEGNEQ